MRISDWSSDVCSSDLAGGGLRRGVEDRGAARGAALAAVADGRQLDDAGLDERVGRLHVHHLGRSGIADRPAAAHEEEAVLVDRQRRIVDAAVIVFRPLEGDGTAQIGREAVRERVGQYVYITGGSVSLKKKT